MEARHRDRHPETTAQIEHLQRKRLGLMGRFRFFQAGLLMLLAAYLLCAWLKADNVRFAIAAAVCLCYAVCIFFVGLGYRARIRLEQQCVQGNRHVAVASVNDNETKQNAERKPETAEGKKTDPVR